MKRYVIVGMVGSGKESDPYRPDVGESWVLVGQRGSSALVKAAISEAISEGSAISGVIVVADVNTDGTVVATRLTAAERTAVRDAMAGRGVDVTGFEVAVVTDRAKLLEWLAEQLGLTAGVVLAGYDVSEG